MSGSRTTVPFEVSDLCFQSMSRQLCLEVCLLLESHDDVTLSTGERGGGGGGGGLVEEVLMLTSPTNPPGLHVNIDGLSGQETPSQCCGSHAIAASWPCTCS